MGPAEIEGHQQESSKSHFSKKESKLSSLSQIINGTQMIASTKKRKRRRKIPTNTTCSGNMKNGITTDFTNSKNDSSSIVLPETSGANISMEQQTVTLQDENASLISFKESGENANEGHKTRKRKRRRNKKKRENSKAEQDEAPRLQRRSRYLLIKMKLEQNLIDAYAGEGWKGQSREKIRPERELQRAKKEILKCKLGIRDAIRQLESLGSVGCMEDSVIAPDGSVHHEHIICAKCKLREAFPDNDIILCDGTCHCAFHQKCLDPPLETENIPQGDQGWLCKFCECKSEILDGMNAHLGTHFSVNCSWQDIFKEEAALPDDGIGLSNMDTDWPSDDSEDDDYDPENILKDDPGESGSDDSNTSVSLSWSFEREAFLESEMSESKNEASKSNYVDEDTDDAKIINGRRQRRAVDYNKLYDEMFGKDAPRNEQHSEDEDWGPAKRKRKRKESDAASTLMTLFGSEKKIETTEVIKEQPRDAAMKRPIFRIPPNALEKLRQVFSQNELPSRSVKESLSKQLGIDLKKVHKWFKNARYSSLKIKKVEIPDDQTDDIKESKDTSPAILVRHLKKAHRRKNLHSLTGTSRKKQLRRALLGSPSKKKMILVEEMSDDMSLKQQMQLLRCKSKEKKLSNMKAEECTQDADVQMERLCRLTGQVEKMKLSNMKAEECTQDADVQMEKLCRLTGQVEKMKRVLLNLESRTPPELNKEPDVMYVPVAKLREKL